MTRPPFWLGSCLNCNLRTVQVNGSSLIPLTGDTTYTGTTTINAGTLDINQSRTLTGDLTLAGTGALELGTATLTHTGTYTQNSGTTLKLSADSATSFGNVVTSGNAGVNSASAVNVTVGNYIPHATTFKIIDGVGGSGVNVPGTITSSDQYIEFNGSSSDGDLILTADRTATGFASVAANSNAAAVGAVLDNVTNASSDMTTILNTLESMSSSQVVSSEDTMSPSADRALIDATNNSLKQFVGTTIVRLQDSKAEEGDKNRSSPETLRRNDVWVQAYGDYAHQDARGISNGYLARLWGEVIGIDRSFMDNSLRIGLAQGFGWCRIRSKDSGGRTKITSYQTGLYGEYAGKSRPYILDAILIYSYNDYNSSRSVSAGAINRTASSEYDGRQFSGYLEGGYKFQKKNFDIIPLLAVSYNHLHVSGYTETGADSLNLTVDAQNYDTLQVGPGIRVSRAFEAKNGIFTPELHFRYFYDVINDKQQTLATFAGGGTSFQTTGYRPAPSSFNIGARLEFFNKKNITLLADCDAVLKDDYCEAGGSLILKYSF